MPSYTRGVLRDQAMFVLVNSLSNIYYGWKTKDFSGIGGVSTTEYDRTLLGHKLGSELPTGAIVILRANSPKPPRISLRVNDNPDVTQQESISTFCAIDKFAAALKAGWVQGAYGRNVRLRSNARGLTAIATVYSGEQELFYAFPMNRADFAAYGDQLGLQPPEAISTSLERAKLIMGSSQPRPGQAELDSVAANGRKTTISHPYSDLPNTPEAPWTSARDPIRT
jgi:hypothetical protein